MSGITTVKDGIWIEVGEFVLLVGKWAILVHIHFRDFDRFFGIDFKRGQFVVDPVIFCENIKEVVFCQD